MPERFHEPEQTITPEIGEGIELSPDEARDAMNRRMEVVFGTDGNEGIDTENPIRVVG